MNFKEQTVTFLKEAQARKRNPIKAATAAKYESSLSHALPLFGDRDLSRINNSDLKVLVAKLSADGLSASTITGVVAAVKLVVASALDEQGNELYPRTWNHEFMDLPVITAQKQPVATPDVIQKAVGEANGSDRALVALLAGTGLRVGEALALTAADWDRVNFTLSITKTVVKGRIQDSTKTEAGNRVVDLTPELNAFLMGLLPTEGLLFPSAIGGVAREMTLYDHLGALGVPGFHSLRRFRATHLDSVGVSRGLAMFWLGHAGKDVHDSYVKFEQNIEARKAWAIRAGLGFQLGAM